MKIRSLEERDLEALSEMVARLARHHGDTPVTGVSVLRRDCPGRAAWLPVWVAEHDGRLLGYAAALRRVQMKFGQRGCELHHLFVDEAWRGQGVEQALVAAVRDCARGQGCGWMTVGTDPENHAAQRFYRDLGFEEVESRGMRFRRRLEAG
ncbi:GNAT family N-acetyltransferase [Marimonas lutisalis]|uniref:GNAT family N-acetyltransferase n=1 Tax=Marimonas lutisalis TaxID=2545756 RepID=UPI001375931A|nr:GNAT family N-acetyltransferase [Marimonas lutisalis]